MGQLASGSLSPLPDHPTPATTFYTAGVDRIDITAYGFDVKLEIMRRDGGYEDPVRIAAGLHRGFTGLALKYKRAGGGGGFRLSNWTAGKPGSCDYEAAGIT